MCVHLCGDDLDYEEESCKLEDKYVIWALYYRYDLWMDERVAIEYIEDNELNVHYIMSSDLQDLSDIYYRVNKFIDVNF